MANETEVPEHGYLICKYGMFYRPDSCGYTSSKSEAGRYSLNMAIDITHPNGADGPRDGMTCIHETEVPDPRADAKDTRMRDEQAETVSMWVENFEAADRRVKALEKRIAELEAQNRELHMQVIASDSQAQMAYEEQGQLEAKLARVTEVANLIAGRMMK